MPCGGMFSTPPVSSSRRATVSHEHHDLYAVPRHSRVRAHATHTHTHTHTHVHVQTHAHVRTRTQLAPRSSPRTSCFHFPAPPWQAHLCRLLTLLPRALLADDTITSPLFDHFLKLGNPKVSAKAGTGVDNSYKQMMKNFDK